MGEYQVITVFPPMYADGYVPTMEDDATGTTAYERRDNMWRFRNAERFRAYQALYSAMKGEKMTDDHGTNQLRIRGNRTEIAAESALGGATCMIDRWHTYADFLRDLDIINQDHHDAFNEFLELWYAANGRNKSGGQGTGEKYQDWISFGSKLGHARLRILQEIRESDPPSSAYQVVSLIDAAVKTQKVASQMGQEDLAIHVAKEVTRLSELKKMRDSIISVHRLSWRLRQAVLKDALDHAQEAFQFLLDEKRKSEL